MDGTQKPLGIGERVKLADGRPLSVEGVGPTPYAFGLVTRVDTAGKAATEDTILELGVRFDRLPCEWRISARHLVRA